jgi:hypothetical protein
MNSKRASGSYAALVRGLIVVVLGIILTAGLWPFHAPRNNAKWLTNSLRFDRHGIAVSRSPFRAASRSAKPCSLEIWLIPTLAAGHGAILAFDSSPDPQSPFALWQYGANLAIQRYAIDDRGIPRRPWLQLDGVFHAGEPVRLTIAAGSDATRVYVNGVLAKQSSTFGLVGRDLTGHLVLANSTMDEGWSGDVSRLAIYDRELTASEITGDTARLSFDTASSVQSEGATALYLFDERDGQIIHNRVDSKTDLTIPARYCVLHPAFLRPWRSPFDQPGFLRMAWSYRDDIALNIVGFIPVGFVFMAYFSSVRGMRWSSLSVICIGFALSFTIEALQRFLPTRDSGMTDLVTNTAGTIIGVALYHVPWSSRLLNKIQESVNSFQKLGETGNVIAIRQVADDDKVSYSA